MPVPVAVLGSCTFDLVFRVVRFPLPGETLFASAFERHAGGKGLNQAIAIQRLGGRATLIARVGVDPFAAPLLDALRADGVDTTHVVVDPSVATGVAAPVVLPGGENCIVAAPGANLAVTVAQVEDAAGAIRGASALLLQFEAPMETNLVAARIAHEAGVPVLLNPAPALEHPPELLALASVLVLNEVEAAMLAPDESSHEARARALRARGPRAVVVTLGPAGAILCDDGGTRAIPPFVVEAVDSVGAGDAFCGALAVALGEGAALEAAVRFASAAGVLSVTRRGAAASLATRGEVDRLLAER